MLQQRHNNIQVALFLHGGMEGGDASVVAVTCVRMSGEVAAIRTLVLVVLEVAGRLRATAPRALHLGCVLRCVCACPRFSAHTHTGRHIGPV